MAQFDAPDADEMDPSLWSLTHTMKDQLMNDNNTADEALSSTMDVVADFDHHYAFMTTAATTIKMEIEGATASESLALDHDHQLDSSSGGDGADGVDGATGSEIVGSRKELSIERRRKRNREAMQRSRQRDKDYMDGLRDTATDLEIAHNQLVAQMNQRLSLNSTDSHASELQAQLESAREQAHELMEQNLKFQAEITDRIKGEDRMEGLLKELLKDQERHAHELSGILFAHLVPHLTMERAMEYILMSRKKRQCIEKKRFQAQAEHVYNFFGWNVRHFFVDKYLYMKFNKTFRNQTAEEIAERAWHHARQLVTYRNKANPRKIAQQLNEDTFIQVLDSRDPQNPYDCVSVFNLRFRVKEPDGVIGIGTQTLPQTHLMDSALENVWASDICMWILFTPVQECDVATGELLEHCRVEFIGKARYGADKLAQQNALETVISLARWEESNVGTTHRLLDTEWDNTNS